MMKRTGITAGLALGLSGCCLGTLQGLANGAGGGDPTAPPAIPGIVAAIPGAVVLGPGFQPDPALASGTAGGPVNAQSLGPDCRGFIGAMPSHTLQVTAALPSLRLVVQSTADTTLVVRRADGTTLCNDDGDGLNPLLSAPFGPGLHQVWVGSYSASATGTPYTLAFTQLPTVTAASLGGGGVQMGGGVITGQGPIPTQCGQTVATYGSLTVGASIVLGTHTPWTGPDGQGGAVTNDANWTPEMAPFVGRTTTITELGGLDAAGCPVVHVAADTNQYFWRIRDLRP